MANQDRPKRCMYRSDALTRTCGSINEIGSMCLFSESFWMRLVVHPHVQAASIAVGLGLLLAAARTSRKLSHR